MAHNVKVDHVDFTLPVTGISTTKDITIAGLGSDVPKFAIIRLTEALVDGTIAADASMYVGFFGTDSAVQTCVGLSSEDGLTASNTSRTHYDDAILNVTNPGTTSVHGEVTAAFIAGGIRLTVTDQFIAAFKGTLIAGTGSDIIEAVAFSHDDLGTGITAVTISTGGIEIPDVVFLGCIGQATVPPNNATNGIICIGATDFTNEALIGFYESDGGAVTGGAGAYNTGAIAQIWSGATTWICPSGGAAAGSFELTPSASAASDIVFGLALTFHATNTPNFKVYDITVPTSGNINEETPGFEPDFELGFLVECPLSRNTVNGTSAVYHLGAHSFSFNGSTTYTDGCAIEDNASSVSDKKSYHATSFNLIDWRGDGATTQASSMAFDSLGRNTTLTGHPVGQEMLGWAFAIDAPSGGDVDPPNLSLPTEVLVDEVTARIGATTDEAITSHCVFTAVGDQVVGVTSNAQVIAGAGGGVIFAAVDKVVGAASAYVHDDFVGLTPGVSYGYAIVGDDGTTTPDAGSRVEGTFTMASFTSQKTQALTVVVGDITVDSIFHYEEQSHNAGDNLAYFESSALAMTPDEYINRIVENRTKNESATITNNTIVRVDGTLSGAADWDNTNVGIVRADVVTGDDVIYAGLATVTAGSVTIPYVVKDAGTDLCTMVVSQIMNPSPTPPDGSYAVSVDAIGDLLLTPAASGAGGFMSNLIHSLMGNLIHDKIS